MSPGLIEKISKLLRRQVYSKGDLILREGEVCRRIYFIEQGLVDVCYYKGERVVRSWLLCEGAICISPKSFFLRMPSREWLTAREDCVLWSIDYDELIALFEEFPEFLWHGFHIILRYYLDLIQKGEDTVKMSAKERYLALYQKSPQLFTQGRIEVVAEYLGFSRTTMARVRRVLGHTMWSRNL
jgi:CRP-like cAMP-binding protein